MSRAHDSELDEMNDYELSCMDLIGALIRMGLLPRLDALWEENSESILDILEVASWHSSTACFFIARTVLHRVMASPLTDVQLRILR